MNRWEYVRSSGDPRYSDSSRQYAAVTGRLPIRSDPYNFAGRGLVMPWYAFGFPLSGRTYNMRTRAEIWLRGKRVARSAYTRFQFTY